MADGDRPSPPAWAPAAQAGSSLVGPVVLGLILDWQFGWTPWATLIGLGLGIVGCLSILIQAANRSG